MSEIFEDVIDVVHDRLTFNAAAYGTAWNGEWEDTKFLLIPVLNRLAHQAETIRAFQEAYGEDYPGSPFKRVAPLGEEQQR